LKISRLSSIEVANASALASSKKLEFLRSIETPRVNWNYQPIHDALPKLLLADSTLFGDLPLGKEHALLDQIAKSCKSGEQQRRACTSVAAALLDWAKREGVTGRIVHTEPLRMSVDTLRYCADVAVLRGGRLYVINLDPRASLTLTAGGKEFIMSLIHHTALIGDLRDATAALLRTPSAKKDLRRAVFEPLEGEPKYSLEEILEMVNETYAIWETILRSRAAGEAKEL
jgi:hypothetical protein